MCFKYCRLPQQMNMESLNMWFLQCPSLSQACIQIIRVNQKIIIVKTKPRERSLQNQCPSLKGLLSHLSHSGSCWARFEHEWTIHTIACTLHHPAGRSNATYFRPGGMNPAPMQIARPSMNVADHKQFAIIADDFIRQQLAGPERRRYLHLHFSAVGLQLLTKQQIGANTTTICWRLYLVLVQ